MSDEALSSCGSRCCRPQTADDGIAARAVRGKEELARGCSGLANCDRQMIERKDLLNSFGPFDQTQPLVGIQELVCSDRQELFDIGQSIGVEMGNGNPTVGVELLDHECGTVDVVRIDPQACTECSDKSSLAGSQLSVQRDDNSGVKGLRNAQSQHVRFGFALTEI